MFYFDGSLSSNKNIQYTRQGVVLLHRRGLMVEQRRQVLRDHELRVQLALVSQRSADRPRHAMHGISLSSYCVDLTGGGKYQLYVFTTGNYEISGSGTNPGHVICWDAIVSGGSQVVSSVGTLPIGTPVSTGTSVITGTPPTGWSG